MGCRQRASHAVRQVLFIVAQTPLKPFMLVVTIHYYLHFRQGSEWVSNLPKRQRHEIQLWAWDWVIHWSIDYQLEEPPKKKSAPYEAATVLPTSKP